MGRGPGLKEETEFRPKPLVLVGDKPILWHIMKIYAAYGYNEFVLALGYKGKMIKDYFLNATSTFTAIFPLIPKPTASFSITTWPMILKLLLRKPAKKA